jgi:hypothetical protein
VVITESMSLSKALADHRGDIVRRWFERVLETYPESTTGFLSKEKDPFRNPVGHTLQKGLSDLFDGLTQRTDVQVLAPVVDDIVKVRAVQDLTAGQALAFPFLLKRILREEFAAGIPKHSEELAALEARIDQLALLAFDLFVQCRERICEIKVNEIKRRAFILERARRKE